jgi:hypothetical protein
VQIEKNSNGFACFFIDPPWYSNSATQNHDSGSVYFDEHAKFHGSPDLSQKALAGAKVN